jgi:hypothetical protein
MYSHVANNAWHPEHDVGVKALVWLWLMFFITSMPAPAGLWMDIVTKQMKTHEFTICEIIMNQ